MRNENNTEESKNVIAPAERPAQSGIGTPYDDVYKTLLNDCRKFIIPVVNEAFQEHYPFGEEISFLPNEHYVNRQDGGEEKRITDSYFQIRDTRYLMECQSTEDGSMLIRMFEYAAQSALDDAVLEKYLLRVKFPKAAVIFLRHSRKTPSKMKIEIETTGGNVTYEIPVVKVQEYTIKEIFEKDLLFFIPFYIFQYEHSLEKMETGEVYLEKLREKYRGIRRELDRRCENGTLTEYEKCMLVDMTRRVLAGIAANYPKVQKGVINVMGGKVLDYEAKDILNRGRAEGKAEGKAEGHMEGRMEGLVAMIVSLQELGISEMKIRELLVKNFGVSESEAEEYYRKFGGTP